MIFQGPLRRQQFKRMFPGTPLTPQPVVTLWGTWIVAALYFADHFDEIKDFVSTLDPEEATTIREAQKVVKSPNLKN